MDDYNEHDAEADSIEIKDITSCEYNQEVLRRLKDNDPDFYEVFVCDADYAEVFVNDEASSEFDYIPNGAHDLGWLGYFIGNNTHLRVIVLYSHDVLDNNLERFCRGLCRNRSIQKISFRDYSGGEIFQLLSPFFNNNHNLMEIGAGDSNLGEEGCRLLSLAIAECSKSLTRCTLSIGNGDGQLVDIIASLSMHPQLQELQLNGTNIGRIESIALATLLPWTTTELHTLDLSNNDIDDEAVEALMSALANGNKLRKLNLSCNPFITTRGWRAVSTLLTSPNSKLQSLKLNNNDIDDEGVEALVDALANGNKLRTLSLVSNPSITTRGWRAVSTLLKSPNSDLEELLLERNGIGDEGAVIFEVALANNCKLKTLALSHNVITAEGWAAFSKLLCDTSSINNTFLSNHILHHIRCSRISNDDAMVPDDMRSYLDLNGGADKKKVAIIKILQNHRHFDMQPLFEWDFKALPLVIDWFERAAACPTDSNNANIGNRKLSSIYQFIRGMPTLYVETRSNKELSEVCATEMKLEREQLELTLKPQDIKHRKMNIMGKL